LTGAAPKISQAGEIEIYPELTPATAGFARHYREALLLAVASPMIAELLSSSAPPLQFFVPWIFALFVLFYGLCALLIREVSLRWGGGWARILLLGSAFGILDEGLAARAFFDPASRSLGPLAAYGRWVGVNWIWSLDAILYHAVFSVAIPILLIYQFFPASRDVRWLGRKAFWTVAVLFGLAAWVFLDSGGHRYRVPNLYLAVCCAVMILLCLLARRGFRQLAAEARPAAISPRRFAALGFGAAAGLLLHIYVVPYLVHSSTVILVILGILVFAVGRTLIAWSGSGAGWSRSQQCGLLVGALGFYAFLALFHEVNPSRTYDATGMSVIGVFTLIGLTWMWRRAGRYESITALPNGLAPQPFLSNTGTLATDVGAFDGAIPFPSVSVRPGTLKVPLLWRLVEITVAVSALTLTSPVMLLLAVLIRRGTPGRALFFQPRVGINSSIFTFVKFRTLYADARERFPELYDYRYSEEKIRDLKFKIPNDPRVTPQGTWMRKSTLDELPNFWNVLTGDMALVGPRPEIPEMMPYYTGEMLLKFSVRPGITGLAQISGRGRLGFHETVGLDVEYVKRHSLVLDLKILFLTALKMITRDGAF
jgi:lipopolysaccharide/colanic/teichoic acid biosynthesis glycosyltransferase